MLKSPKGIVMYFLIFFLVLLLALATYLVLGGPKLPSDTDAIIENVLKSELPQVIRGEAGFVTSDGLQIWYECIAPAGEPQGVVLLNTGMAGDAIAWPPMFVRAFVDAGYRVIRYDFRGTGMSDWVEHWNSKHPYSLADMAKDAVAVLDALNVDQAHLVGLSLGGMVAQEIAVHNPERVSSLTLMSTSGYAGDPQFPILSSRHFFMSIAQGLPILKYRLMGGEKNLIKERIAKMVMAGIEVDIQETAEVVLYELRKRKGFNIKALLQHRAASDVSGSRYESLRMLEVPTLVIHGTDDKVFPIDHGKRVAELIPGAEALWLEGVGHVFPYPNMGSIHARILSHLAK
ncbi:alpha/beta hydrolase [Candidatus Chloroploca sp. M-50]|uniref:Alpha/beta hydrolase n=1 Tax=Candidatus Chloroploca mongolica TaxID=2528176 RepID=A0ABS4DCG9_9CHLR|nr:alpha/beta hydrolase [Candidatus Chloroploca mongolica]MBP1467138.1 alpha/beta hydrolase [Candidatus Chloroploca mongolica]